MAGLFFKVPFIATYRKEYIEPELKVDDLWIIFDFDAKVTYSTSTFMPFMLNVILLLGNSC